MKPALRADDSSIRHVVGRQRHVDGENAAFAGYIPDVDVAFVCPDGLASNRQPQAEPRPISPAPLTERLNGSPTVGDTPALVFHLDQESCAFGADPQNHLASGSRGFERIVQEVRDGRLQKLRVPGYHPFRVDGRHNERKATDLGVQRACVRDVIEKRPDSDLLTFLVLGSQSDISLLVGNKIAQFHEAPPQHESRAAVDGNSAPLQHLIGHEGSVEFVTKLMSEYAPTYRRQHQGFASVARYSDCRSGESSRGGLQPPDEPCTLQTPIGIQPLSGWMMSGD